MSAGIQVIGDHGSVQIDQNYYNMVLITNGYATTSYQNFVTPDDTGYAPKGYLASITYTGTSPVICVDSRGTPISQFTTIQNGNTYTFYFATFDGNGNPAAATFAYYIYDIVPNIQATNQGLTIWNQNGHVTFNSDYEPMRIINFGTVPSGWTTQQAQVLEYFPPGSSTWYSSGQKIAVSLCPPKAYYVVIHMLSNDNYIETFLTNNGASPPYITTEGGGQNGSGSATPYGYMGNSSMFSYNQNAGTMFMVDVTNHYLP